MKKIKNLNKTKKGKEKRKEKRKTYKIYKGGVKQCSKQCVGDCKGPMCTICQECLTIRDDPKYSKYFDMLEDEIKVVVQQRMTDDGVDPAILDSKPTVEIYQHETCGSFFHMDCITSWCITKKNVDECPCPNCNQPIDFKQLTLDVSQKLKLCEFRKDNIVKGFIDLRDRYNSLATEREELIEENNLVRKKNSELGDFARDRNQRFIELEKKYNENQEKIKRYFKLHLDNSAKYDLLEQEYNKLKEECDKLKQATSV